MQINRRHFVQSLGTLAASAALLPTRARAADELRIAFIPDVGTTGASISEKQPFIDYFAKALDRPIKLIIPTNYAATVEALGNESVDLAYFGGLTYLKAHERYGAVPIAQRIEDRQFHALFITNDAEITALKDLKGKTFAFGDVNSTSGHLIPVKEMTDAGIDVDKDITARFTGTHPATAIAVNSGQVQAGAIDETVYHKMVSDKSIDPAKTRVFHTSKPFADYVWAARKTLDAPTIARIRTAFVDMSDPKVLALMRGSKYVAVTDAEYEPLRAIARKLGLL